LQRDNILKNYSPKDNTDIINIFNSRMSLMYDINNWDNSLIRKLIKEIIVYDKNNIRINLLISNK
jgi:hypothetical protein